LCEPGLMGLTSRQARFVSGPQIRTLPTLCFTPIVLVLVLVLDLDLRVRQ